MVDIWNCPSKDPDYEKHQAERLAWFNKIAPRKNWKMPIACWVSKEDFDNCNQAAIYFTGSPLKITIKQGPMRFVKAPGYYNTIGS